MHLTTILNEVDWELRAAMFRHIPNFLQVLGYGSFIKEFLFPIMMEALYWEFNIISENLKNWRRFYWLAGPEKWKIWKFWKNLKILKKKKYLTCETDFLIFFGNGKLKYRPGTIRKYSFPAKLSKR